MATELATAYLTLVPSLKGADKAIRDQLQGINLSSVGTSMGNSMTSGITSQIPKIASAVNSAGTFFSNTFGRAAKVAVGAIGGVGASIAALAAHGGMARVLNLEQAQTMFKGLKLEWADFEETINKAVDGTAFSLDAAALVAANLAASGVSAGEEMDRALRGAVGTAATFGSDLGEIGSIFQKVAAQGKLTGETIAQFADRGVNVTAVLSEALGKTGDEIKQMVKDGKIDFETFSKAMEAAFGDSAQAANETFTGSLGNMKSALNRIGADFMTPIEKNAIPVFNSIRLALNSVKASLQPLVAAFTEFVNKVGGQATAAIDLFTAGMNEGKGIVESIKGAIDGTFGEGTVSKIMGLVSVIGGLAALGPVLKASSAGMLAGASAFEKISSVAAPIVSAMGSAGSAVLGFSKNLAGAATSAVSTFSQAMARGFTPSSILAKLDGIPDSVSSIFARLQFNVSSSLASVSKAASDKFSALGNSINDALGGVPGKIGGLFSGIGEKIGLAAELASNSFKEKFNIGSHVSKEGGILSSALGKVKGGLGSIGGFAMSAVGGLAAVSGGLLVAGVAAITAGVDIKAAADSFLVNIQAVTANLPAMAAQVAEQLPVIVEQVVAALPALVEAFATAISSLVEVFPVIIPQVIDGLTQMIVQLIPVIIELMPMLLEAGIQLFTALVNSLSVILPVLIEQLPLMVEMVGNCLIENMPLLLSAAGTLFMALVTAFLAMMPDLISKLPSLIGQIVSGLIAALPQIGAAAGTLFQAIVEAVPKILDSLLTAIGELLGNLPGAVTDFASNMGQAAEEMIQGMVDGIGNAAEWVANKVRELCGGALDAIKGFFGIASPSKLMRRMFGYVGQGMVLGLADQEDALVSKMEDMAGNVAAAASGAEPTIDVSVNGRRAGKVDAAALGPAPQSGNVFNIYSNDPEAVAAMVAARQRRAAMA